MKRNKVLILGAALALGLSSCASSAIVMRKSPLRAIETTTYTFTSKSWAAANGNWTSGKDGNSLTSGRGVQVTTGVSGANATSPTSFVDVSQIVVTYSTNASAGVGSISVQIGTNAAQSKDVTKNGGTTDRTLTYDYSSFESGNVKITVTCTTNSIYVKSVAINCDNGGSGPVQLSSPAPQYDEVNNVVTWANVSNAVGYQVSVNNESSYTNATSPFNGNFEVGDEYTVYVKAVGDGENYTDSASASVTFTAVAPFVSKNYILCKSIGDLEIGDIVIIGNASTESVKFLSSTQNSNNRGATASISVVDGLIASTAEVETITLGKSDNNWTLYANSTPGYLYAASNSANQLKTRAENSDPNSEWSIAIDSNGTASITAQGTNAHNQLKNNGDLFSCYASGQTAVSIWKEYKELSSLNVVGSPTKLSGYYDSQKFDPAGITSYQAVYSDSSTKILSSDKIIWPSLEANMGTIRGSYTENGITVYTPTYNISVAADTLSTISLSGTMKTSYYIDENWNEGNLVVTATYASGTPVDATKDSSFAYYSDSALTNVLETPSDLGNGENQTIYVKATYSGVSNSTGYAQTVNILGARPGTQDNPYTVAQAINAIDAGEGTTNVYAQGIVSKIVTPFDSQYGNISYNISADGLTASDQLEAYRGKSYGGANFTSEDDIQVGDIVVIYGNLIKYESTYEFAADNKLVSLVRPELTPEEQVSKLSTISTLSYNYTKIDGTNSVIDTLNYEFLGVTGTSYTNWPEKEGASGAVYAGESAGGNNSIQLRSSDSKSGIITTASGGIATKVSVEWNSNSSDGRTIDIYGKDSAYEAASDLYDNAKKGTKIGSIVYGTSTELTIDGEYAYIGIRSSSGALYLDGVAISWRELDTFTYSNVSVKFGGFIEKALWDELENIEGYGVMYAATEDLNGEKLSPSNARYDLFVDQTTKANPSQANNTQKVANGVGDSEDVYYIWNLRINISDSDYFKSSLTAVAYIKTSEGYIYLRETSASVKDLASDYINNRGYSANDFEGSLAGLANL